MQTQIHGTGPRGSRNVYLSRMHEHENENELQIFTERNIKSRHSIAVHTGAGVALQLLVIALIKAAASIDLIPALAWALMINGLIAPFVKQRHEAYFRQLQQQLDSDGVAWEGGYQEALAAAKDSKAIDAGLLRSYVRWQKISAIKDGCILAWLIMVAIAILNQARQ